MFGLFKKFKEGFAKTLTAISEKTGGLFGGRAIDASSLESLEEALYTADFGVETTTEILTEIKAAYKKEKDLRGQDAAAIGAAVLKRVLAGSEGVLDVAGVADPGPEPGSATPATAIKSLSTLPAPTLGSWSVSPTSRR